MIRKRNKPIKMTNRPEFTGPPELFYNEKESKKYSQNNHIIEIQRQMTERAYELLALEEGKSHLLLDIGCGSGLSGDVLSEHKQEWIGMDISESMLDIAIEREIKGDLIHQDIGQGFSFRIGTFDGAISISAIQWLCNQDKKSHNPARRLHKFFFSLYKCLKKGARAVFQLYTENTKQMELITSSAMKVGFSGGLIIDYPHSTRAKKYYLCLFAGIPNQLIQMPKAKGERKKRKEEKKERPEKTSKYSGRKRKIYF